MGSRYFIFLTFKGTRYHGWQIQPGAVTVQKIIDEAVTVITGEKTSTTGAGRTDSGVHARFFCAHFDSSQSDLDSRKNLVYRINRYLPSDVSVTGIRRVRPDANARYSASARTYEYHISLLKDPFLTDTAWHLHGDPDIVSMNLASRLLLSCNDFTSFCRLHSDNRTNICRVYHAYWKKEAGKLIFSIKADRFLRNMVRAIVGTLAEVGKGKLSVSGFKEIIDARNRSAAGTSAPAKGLFLTGIEYPEEIFLPATVPEGGDRVFFNRKELKEGAKNAKIKRSN
jgi:tRNA pseudouridine38-40 synthase